MIRQIRISICILIFITTSLFTLAQEACVSNSTCGVEADVIAQYPYPNVTPLNPQDSLIYDRAYRQIDVSLQIFDAPNGNLVNDFGAGFNYVTIGEQQGDWTRIGDAMWVRTHDLNDDVAISRFAGVLLPETPLPYQMAWILRHLYPAEIPGGDPSESNELLYRYTRVNIYSSIVVDGYNWYQIGENQWVHQFNIAKIIPVEKPADVDTHKWISVDLYEQVVIAYEDDTPVFASLASSGLAQWPTNEGVFHVYLRFERTRMSGAYNQPDFYYLEEVPWTMYFDDDIALHGTYWHDGFGFRQSHGCVNLSITDAHWLFEWASDEFNWAEEDIIGPAVYVYSSGEYD